MNPIYLEISWLQETFVIQESCKNIIPIIQQLQRANRGSKSLTRDKVGKYSAQKERQTDFVFVLKPYEASDRAKWY